MINEKHTKELLRKTRKFAKEKAAEIRKQVGSKKIRLAKHLFSGFNLGYGFEDSIMDGHYAHFPHELKDKAECVDYSVYQYFVAEALGLDPQLHFVYGITNHDVKVKKDYGTYDHSFIDVDVGAKRRVITDSQLGMFGYVDYDRFKGTITVRDNPATHFILPGTLR